MSGAGFHSMSSGFFYLNSLDWSISLKGVSGKFLLLPWFTEIPVLNANSVDPDQMPRSVSAHVSFIEHPA